MVNNSAAIGTSTIALQNKTEPEKKMKNVIVRFIREDAGQDLIEYALLGAFVSLAAAVGAQALGTSLNNWYTNIGTGIDALPTTPLP